MQTFRTFNTSKEASEYRYEHGTGGWIFASNTITILFPPCMSPQDIFLHPFTRGMNGELIGNS